MFEEEVAAWTQELTQRRDEDKAGVNGTVETDVDSCTNSRPLLLLRSTSFPEIVHEVIELAGRDAACSSYRLVSPSDRIREHSTASSGIQPRGLVLICGTAYFMPQVRAALGIQEPR